jgi:hypothetical protein
MIKEQKTHFWKIVLIGVFVGFNAVGINYFGGENKSITFLLIKLITVVVASVFVAIGVTFVKNRKVS